MGQSSVNMMMNIVWKVTAGVEVTSALKCIPHTWTTVEDSEQDYNMQ